jgi:hypothetical protein
MAATTSPETRRRAPTALLSWVASHKALVAFCALVGAYYLWTVWSSGNPFAFGQNRDDYFNLLSDAFLHGKLHLLVEPPKELLTLSDPYDPAQNGNLALHDASLYKGHYYLYWGPVPALLLFIPFRLLPFGDLPETLAVFIFAFVGFCFSIAVLRILARRYAPEAPRWMLGAVGVALAFGNALPFTLRRASMYELAIAAGFCFLFIALYLVLTGLPQNGAPRWRRLALASLSVGLAVGCRPTAIVGVVALLVLTFVLARRAPGGRRAQARIAAILLGPAAAIGILIAVYNVARFGSPLEFGTNYILAAYNPRVREANQIRYVLPGLWYFLLSRPHLTIGFPFIHLMSWPDSYPLPLPHDYDGIEPVAGLLVSVPFSLFALAAPFVLRGTPRRIALGLLGAVAIVLLLVTAAIWGATMRYEVDFASYALLAAALVWLTIAGVRADDGPRRILRWGGTALIAWGALFGVAAGIVGYYSGLQSKQPGTFLALQKLTGPIPLLASRIDGKPKLVDVASPYVIEDDSDPGPGVGTFTGPLGTQPLILTIFSGKYTRAGLELTGGPPEGLPPPPATTITLKLLGTDRTLQLPAVSGPTLIALPLRRGINRVSMSVDVGYGRVSDVALTEAPEDTTDPWKEAR